MRKELLKYLVCPQCGRGLVCKSGFSADSDTIFGTLDCVNDLASRHSYLITESVPRLLPNDGSTPEAQRQTADSFSDKWAAVPDYGYDPASETFWLKWYLERYGWTVGELGEFLASREFILDAGTGLGGQVKTYAELSSGQVFGVDISRSIDIAHEHLRDFQNVHLIQADFTRLPFRKGTFDFIVSDGVLHHTPNTEAAFLYLAGFLAPGGQIAIYVYKRKAPLRELADDWIRERTTKMTWRECYEFSEQLALLGKALTNLKADVVIERDIPLLGVKAGKQDVQRFLYWTFLKCFWNDKFDLKGNTIINADWYHPVYAWRHTPEEVRRWFQEAGLKILHEDVSESGISLRGLRE